MAIFDWFEEWQGFRNRAKGCPVRDCDEDEFKRRFRAQFLDPAFDVLCVELDKITDAAWDAYQNSRKSPHTRKAGPEFADPDYDLSIDWIAAREAIAAAQRRHEDAAGPNRILLINCSSRSEHTCPGEMSKSFRLAEIAREVFRCERGRGRVPRHASPPNTAATSTPARRASRPRRRSATGRAPAIRTIRSARPRTG